MDVRHPRRVGEDLRLRRADEDAGVHALGDIAVVRRDGLHVILTRSSGGSGQGMFEPVMRSLRDMGTPGVLLSLILVGHGEYPQLGFWARRPSWSFRYPNY